MSHLLRRTGMDPLSRRFVWKHIDEVKEGRVILLTTHAMEEADLLADTVAVSFSMGFRCCFGIDETNSMFVNLV